MSTDVDSIDVGAIEDQGAAPVASAPETGANGDVNGTKPPKAVRKRKTKSPPRAPKSPPDKAARSANGKARDVPSVPAPTSQAPPLIFTHPGPDMVRRLMPTALVVSMLAQPVRMAIVGLLSASDSIIVGQLCVRLGGYTQPAISHHLALLRHCGMVHGRRDGKTVAYALTDKGRKLAGLLQILLD